MNKTTLLNVTQCMALCEDMRNPNNAVIVNAAYKWIRQRLEQFGELTTPDRKYFINKYYYQGKNKGI